MSCPNCNAPMAVDQRYCLNCGVRGGEARLPFLDILRADSEAQLVPYGQPLPPMRSPVGAALPPPAVGFQEQMRVNSGLIAGVGVLLLAMLVGVLIGRSGTNNEPIRAAAPQPPQIIQVGGGAPVAAAATAATGAEGATAGSSTPSSSASSSSKTKASKASSAKDSSATAASQTNDPKAPAKATNNAVKSLDKLTGAARVKAVDKLGKNIATGGKAPKKDSKPAGAGGGFQEIG